MAQGSADTELDPRRLPKILARPPVSGKVLVLAPHADDETIGLGGTIVLHGEQGDPVDVLFLTRGGTGNAGGRYDPAAYEAIRRQEGTLACQVLGVRETIFWEYADNYVVTESDMAVLVPRLAAVVKKGGYDVLYTPHRGELHTDHHASAVLAARAVDRLDRPPRVFGYEVWAPLAADFVVDVTRVFEKKLEAAACYASQLDRSDITRLFKCLNGYRAILLEDRAGYGEAFMNMAEKP